MEVSLALWPGDHPICSLWTLEVHPGGIPTPPENPTPIHRLSPPNSDPPKPALCLDSKSFDKQATCRFSLAFQCIVNISVRRSEPIWSCAVQAGTLDLADCILEAWLASEGFAIGPNPSASGMPCETREQRLTQRQAQAEQHQRDQAAQLSRTLQCQIIDNDFGRYGCPTPAVIDIYVAQVSLHFTVTQSMITHHPLTKDEPMANATQDPPLSAASVDSTASPERRDHLLCHDLLPSLNVLIAACGPHASDLDEYTSTRKSLFYPPSLPLSAALEITDHPIPNAVRNTLFPTLPKGHHITAVRDMLEIVPKGGRMTPLSKPTDG